MIYSIHNNSSEDINIVYSLENNEQVYEQKIATGEKEILYTSSKTKLERDCKKGNSFTGIKFQSINWVEDCGSSLYDKSTSDCENWITDLVSGYMTYTLKIGNKDFN